MGTLQAISTAVLILASLSWSQLGYAATNVVLNLKDGLSIGTLRSVIANSAAGDIVLFSNSLTGTISLTDGGPLLINKNLAIQGPGAKAVTISGTGNSRVCIITNATVSLTGLTIANGRVAGTTGGPASAGETTFGAGLLNLHSTLGYEVTVADCAFVQNSVVGGNGGGTPFGGGGAGGDAYGGAIFNNSSLTLRNCCFAGNSVAGGNGGAGSPAGGGGGAALGAGLCNAGTITLINCTLATNVATGGIGGDTPGGLGSLSFPGSGGNAEGSGIYSTVQLFVSSCTIVSNTAIGGVGGSGGMRGGLHGGAYGGIRSVAGNSTIRNTIIADNTAQQARDISGDFVSQGFNLVGTTNGGTGFGVACDQVGATNSPVHALVNPLRDNGGATLTFQLQTNSPAIDRGNSFGETSDQRGAARPSDFPLVSNSDDGSDIGAYELIAPLLIIAQSTNNILLSWSVFNPGYTLQSATNPGSGDWVSIGSAPVEVGGQFYISNTISGGHKFFRLHSP